MVNRRGVTRLASLPPTVSNVSGAVGGRQGDGEAGNVLGFSVLRISALGEKPLEISL